jgi:DNA-directed RNA polymerase subunit RPC12/RpoP
MTREGSIENTAEGVVLMYDPEKAMVEDSTRVAIEIPRECPECGFRNFYVWGTKMNGIINIVVKCMRCGK